MIEVGSVPLPNVWPPLLAAKVSESFTARQGAARTEDRGLVASSTPSEGVLGQLIALPPRDVCIGFDERSLR